MLSEIAIHALEYLGTPFAAGPKRGDCFDCVAFLTALTGADIPAKWMDDGGVLPFAAIDLCDARPGDIISFKMPWDYRPYHAAVLVAGENINDHRARITGPYLCHASVTSWLAPYWRPFATSAWRASSC